MGDTGLAYDAVRLEAICNDLGLIAMRDEGVSRWHIGMRCGDGSWSWVRILSLSDMELLYTPWSVIEKRIVSAVMEENFG
jgi:hypothetical protein